MLTHSISPIIIVGGLILIYDFLRKVVQPNIQISQLSKDWSTVTDLSRGGSLGFISAYSVVVAAVKELLQEIQQGWQTSAVTMHLVH